MKRILAIVVFMMSALPSSSYALGTVSRACRFSTIPSLYKGIAVKFFVAMGAPQSTLELPNKSLNEQAEYWINESLTTDYGNVRYYLFATSLQYVVTSRTSEYSYNYAFSHQVDSPWTLQAISAAMKADPDFSPYYVNRGPAFSVRAGAPSIVEHLGSGWIEAPMYYVVGKHWYYDPVSKATGRLQDTRAINCNLGNWGLGLFDR